MSINDQVPTNDDFESLLVNNEAFERISAYLNRFNPIKVMRMERMEIRHSAILAWLLDPSETHGLSDKFLKAFLAEAFRGRSSGQVSTALGIWQCDLRDAEIRREWQNIDIFILSKTNSLAFIVENKFDSAQHEGQLSKYTEKVRSIYRSQEDLAIGGVLLTLWDEEPADAEFAPIRYSAIGEILEQQLARQQNSLSPDIKIFLNHYLEIIKDATGMSTDLTEMEAFARQLYRSHKKTIDFIVEHGASTDFAIAAQTYFGDNPKPLQPFKIDDQDFIYYCLSRSYAGFLPASWFDILGSGKTKIDGCDGAWAGFPLMIWLSLISDNDGTKGKLKIVAEVGPISNYEWRKDLIDKIASVGEGKGLENISFQRTAADEGKKYSRFLRKNTINVTDIHDSEAIAEAMKKLIKRFSAEFEAVADVLPETVMIKSTFAEANQ